MSAVISGNCIRCHVIKKKNGLLTLKRRCVASCVASCGVVATAQLRSQRDLPHKFGLCVVFIWSKGSPKRTKCNCIINVAKLSFDCLILFLDFVCILLHSLEW